MNICNVNWHLYVKFDDLGCKNWTASFIQKSVQLQEKNQTIYQFLVKTGIRPKPFYTVHF